MTTQTKALTRRADFPGLLNMSGQPWHYLDSAATAQKPQAVIDAMARALGPDYATVHRGVYSRSAEMTLAYEAARRRVAAFLGGARGRDRLHPRRDRGDQSCRADMGHGEPEAGRPQSCFPRWSIIRTSCRGNCCANAPASRSTSARSPKMAGSTSTLPKAMLTPAHKLVALAHVSNVLGSTLDARRAADLAHAVGAKLLIDGCQAVPRIAVDVAALDCDFYVFSAHKLYGPTGIGALVGTRRNCSMRCRRGKAAAR